MEIRSCFDESSLEMMVDVGSIIKMCDYKYLSKRNLGYQESLAKKEISVENTSKAKEIE